MAGRAALVKDERTTAIDSFVQSSKYYIQFHLLSPIVIRVLNTQLVLVPVICIDVAETRVEGIWRRCMVIHQNTVQKDAHRIVRFRSGNAFIPSLSLSHSRNHREL